jgi:hypothetical protein
MTAACAAVLPSSIGPWGQNKCPNAVSRASRLRRCTLASETVITEARLRQRRVRFALTSGQQSPHGAPETTLVKNSWLRLKPLRCVEVLH